MIRYVIGDATNPPEATEAGERRVIAHVCNDVGAWGAGFVLALSARWSRPEGLYRSWAATTFGIGTTGTFALGEVQIVRITDDLFVCNMIAQRGFPTATDRCALDYEALAACLDNLSRALRRSGLPATIHMPRIGCGIAGGEWSKVEAIIEDRLSTYDVTVYDLPARAMASA